MRGKTETESPSPSLRALYTSAPDCMSCPSEILFASDQWAASGLLAHGMTG